MEMIKENSFRKLSEIEKFDVNGGVATEAAVLTACGTIAAVGGAIVVCYKVGTGIGKFIKNLMS